MTQEELSNIKFHITGHLVNDRNYVIKSESDDKRIVIIDNAYIPKTGKMSSSFRQYVFDGKVYKTMSSFLNAILKSKEPFIDWEDCIHIGACRRFSKIVEAKTGKPIARGCGEKCNMYKSRSALIEKIQDIDIDGFIEE